MNSGHMVGVLLVLISAVVFSTMGIFTKGVSADAYGVIFWRGLSAAILTLLFLQIRGVLASEWRGISRPFVVVTLVMSSGTAAFIPAFKLTSVANVALIWAASPFLAAGLAWLVLRERPSKQVILGSALAVVGVLIVLGGSFGAGSIVGDMLAMWMTLMMATTFVLYRKYPETPAGLPAALSSLVLLPYAAAFSNPLDVGQRDLIVLLFFGAIFAVASVTMLEGARRIPAPEVALIGALEMPLAVIWAYFILSEVPTFYSVLGGAVVFVAVIISQWMPRRARTPHQTPL